MLNKKELLRKYFGLLSEHKIKLAISIILLVISTVCIVYAPKLAGQTVNLFLDSITSDERPIISRNIIILLILYPLAYLLQLPSKRIEIFIGEKDHL